MQAKQSNYYDKYLYFTFNNVCSGKYGLFITNKGGDQTLVASPDKTVSFTTPEYQNNTYYLGTTKKQKTFKKNVAAEGLTWAEIQEMMLWLEVGTKGFLFFDTDRFWGWDVVVTNLGDVTYHELGRGYYVVEFMIEWKTYGDWHARSTVSASILLNGKEPLAIDGKYYYSTIANQYGIPEVIENATDKTEYDFIGVSDAHSFVDISFEIPSVELKTEQEYNFQIIKTDNQQNSETIVDYIIAAEQLATVTDADKKLYHYYGQYGFLIDVDNNNLIEDSNLLKKSKQSSGILEIDNVVPIQIQKSDITKIDSVYYLDYKYYSKLNNSFYLVYSEKVDNNSTYNDIGDIAYGAEYKVVAQKIIKTVDDNIKKIKLGTITAPQDQLIYLCNFTTVQIVAPQVGTLTVTKHNNNN